MKKWKRLKHNQFDAFYVVVGFWIASLLALPMLYMVFKEKQLLYFTGIWFAVGFLCIGMICFKWGKVMKLSRMMERFVRNNGLYISHHVRVQGILGERRVESFEYYPTIEYRIVPQENIFCIRIRMDGCRFAEKFRDLETPLAGLFRTVCTDKIFERGYLTYCFELQEQKQGKIQTCADIPKAGENEIVFSDIIWNWKKTPHLLLIGNTGSGKTQVTQYIISCLEKQGVRVIYCDPKKDDDMRTYMIYHPSVKYVTKEKDIAKAVREVEEEIRSRERDLQGIGIEEAEFNPVFLIVDELIAFSKIADKQTYDETTRRLSAVVVSGRSKRIYCAMVLQRADTSFIEGAIRDNLGCRICMGQMSDTAYKMAFGSDFSDVRNNRREIGSGLIYRQGVDTKPREFLAPYIYEGALNRE